MCYDREVARFQAPVAKAAPAPQTEATTIAPAQAAPAPQVTPTPANVPTAQAAATTGAPPAAAGSSASAGAGSATHSDPQHLTARIVSIDHRPNELTWHLDNGQVWQEVQGVAGDLSLREGDTVKIDKHMGSYWLSGPHVASMRVRQKD